MMSKGWLPWAALQNQLPFWAMHFLPVLTPALLAECRWNGGNNLFRSPWEHPQVYLRQHASFKINRGVRQPLPALFPDLTLESVFFLVGWWVKTVPYSPSWS